MQRKFQRLKAELFQEGYKWADPTALAIKWFYPISWTSYIMYDQKYWNDQEITSSLMIFNFSEIFFSNNKEGKC